VLRLVADVPCVYVSVTAPAEIVEGPRDFRVVWGTEVILECEVVGIPFPSRSWTKNGKVVSNQYTCLLQCSVVYCTVPSSCVTAASRVKDVSVTNQLADNSPDECTCRRCSYLVLLAGHLVSELVCH